MPHEWQLQGTVQINPSIFLMLVADGHLKRSLNFKEKGCSGELDGVSMGIPDFLAINLGDRKCDYASSLKALSFCGLLRTLVLLDSAFRNIPLSA